MSSATETLLVASRVTIRPGSLWARLPVLGMVLGMLDPRRASPTLSPHRSS